MWSSFLQTILALSCLLTAGAVQIRQLAVPPLVELGAPEAVLDCVFEVDPKASAGLVVKWFFNTRDNMVYQWIPPRAPQDRGIFRGKLDLGYKASQEPLYAHRALKILNPTAEMSGNYTCVVSTFDEDNERSKSMLVFTPGKNFQLQQMKHSPGAVKLNCFAENVFPQPTLTITSQSKVIKDLKMEVWAGEEGLFDVIGEVVVRDEDLGDPEEFVCEMRVPQANYTARKQAIYYPGVMPTAQLTAAVDSALEVHGEGSRSSRPAPGPAALAAALGGALLVGGLLY